MAQKQNMVDAGADGDCLFHSIAAALEQMVQRSPAAAAHAPARVPLTMLCGSTDRVVAHLRLLSANAMDEWPPETFLDYMVNRALDQSIGGFQDAWDPTGLLQKCGFECLVGCDNVQA